ncbi:hypothetical protein GGF31_003561 [Allomyces arbusculus]|nr:hypothetical protein GGF31_003561 [Allomyces arbusculus]
MVDVVLILTTVIFALLIIIGSIYFVVYFQHPDDKWVAWFPKIVVVLSLSVACYNIFLLPLDVANQQGNFTAAGGIPMTTINFSFFIASVILGLVTVPFVMFYYEGVDDKDDAGDSTTTTSQVVYAFKWIVPTVVVFGIIDYLLWAFLGYVNVNTTTLTAPLMPGDAISASYCADANVCKSSTAVDTIHVSVLISTVAFATLIGWLLFSVFSGVGLVALPFDLLMEFKYRPKPIKAEVYKQRKKVIGEQAALLLQAAEEMEKEGKDLAKVARTAFNKKSRVHKKKEQEFKRDVLLLENQYRLLELSYKSGGINVLAQFGKLFLGFIGTFLSLFWILHICIYMLPPLFGALTLTSFLNDFLISLQNIPFIGIAFYALFTFWLLLCVIKGTTKMGMRILFLSVHPMRIGETMMSSLVFNSGLIVLSSLAVAQFSTWAFQDYARYTSSSTIFLQSILNLRELKYCFNVLIFVILGFVVLTFFYVLYRPYTRQQAKGRIIDIKF